MFISSNVKMYVSWSQNKDFIEQISKFDLCNLNTFKVIGKESEAKESQNSKLTTFNIES